MPAATDEKLAADLASFRAEITKEIGVLRADLAKDMGIFRADLAGFQGEVRSDLRWIKGIGMALPLTAFSFAGWIIADMATVKTDVRQHESRLDKIESRLDGIEKKLDVLIERSAPKAP
jgi:hypothetical protein